MFLQSNRWEIMRPQGGYLWEVRYSNWGVFGVIIFRRRKRKSKRQESSEDEENYERKISRSESLTKHDVVLLKDFKRTHSGGTKVPSESPLSREIDKVKIIRKLKVPSKDQFHGSTDPSDFVHLVDGRMAFYGTLRSRISSSSPRAWRERPFCGSITSLRNLLTCDLI